MFGCEVEGLVAAVAVLSAVLSVLAFAPSPPRPLPSVLLFAGSAVPAGAGEAPNNNCHKRLHTQRGHVQTQLIVAADHIVIDGNGHYLIGSGSYEGVVVDGRTSVTVKNLKATNWTTAFKITYSVNVTLQSNTAANCSGSYYYGFYLYRSNSSSFMGNAAENCNFYLDSSGSNVLIGTVEVDNDYGFAVYGSFSVVRGCVALNCSGGLCGRVRRMTSLVAVYWCMFAWGLLMSSVAR
ncbi:MAG: right-handed parallel beta-helix repeat-containing protein [Candidatus Jordarchaeales archaeon]